MRKMKAPGKGKEPALGEKAGHLGNSQGRKRTGSHMDHS